MSSSQPSPKSSTVTSSSSSPPAQKHVLKFSVDSMLSEKCPPSREESRERSRSPDSVTSEDESPRESSPKINSSMTPFSMDGILNKQHSMLRSDAVPSAIMSHVASERWNGFYGNTTFPWLPGSISPPKGSLPNFVFISACLIWSEPQNQYIKFFCLLYFLTESLNEISASLIKR